MGSGSIVRSPNHGRQYKHSIAAEAGLSSTVKKAGHPGSNPGRSTKTSFHCSLFPLMKLAVPCFFILMRFFRWASSWKGLRKSNFSQVSNSPHSQQPCMLFFWQQFLILQDGDSPPPRQVLLQRNLTIAPMVGYALTGIKV